MTPPTAREIVEQLAEIDHYADRLRLIEDALGVAVRAERERIKAADVLAEVVRGNAYWLCDTGEGCEILDAANAYRALRAPEAGP